MYSKAKKFQEHGPPSRALSKLRFEDFEDREEPTNSPGGACISPGFASLHCYPPEIRRDGIDRDQEDRVDSCQARLNLLQNRLQELENVQVALKQQLLVVENEYSESKSLGRSNYEALCAMTEECLSIEEELNEEKRLFKESVAVLEKEVQLCRFSISERDREIAAVKEAYECAVKGASAREAELLTLQARNDILESRLAVAEGSLRLMEEEVGRLRECPLVVAMETESAHPRTEELQLSQHLNPTLSPLVILQESVVRAQGSLTSDPVRAELSMWKSKYHELLLQHQSKLAQADSLWDGSTALKQPSQIALSQEPAKLQDELSSLKRTELSNDKENASPLLRKPLVPRNS